MTKGWSAGLLFALICLLISRTTLHIGGVWHWKLLDWIERRFPVAAQVFSFESIKRRQERMAAVHHPAMSILDRIDQVTMLGAAVFFGVLGILLLLTVFFGGPL